ncbi:MAG: phage tail tube protein [Actinomycetota bacterium]
MTGLDAQLAYAKESVANTREVPDHFLGFASENLQHTNPVIPIPTLAAGRKLPHRHRRGNKSNSGSFTFPLLPESTGELLELCVGGVVTTGSGPYVHTITPGDLSTATIQAGRPDKSGTVHPFDYVGAMISAWTMTIDASGDGNPVNFTPEWAARQELTDQSLVAAAYPSTQTHWTSVEASMTLAGSAFPIDSLNIAGNNGLEIKHYAGDANPVIRESGWREISATIATDLDGLTAYNRYKDDTSATIVVTIGSSASLDLEITMNGYFVSPSTPNVEGPQVTKQNLPFMCESVTTDAAAFTAVLTNSDANP